VSLKEDISGEDSVSIHPSAVVNSSAELGRNVQIGPHSIVGQQVVIGDDVWIANGVVVQKNTRIGSGCRIYTGAVLGTDPQDLKYKGEETFLEIGARTTIREYVTINLGTAQRGKTVVGDDTMLMSYVHIAHDCDIGDHVILANTVNMGGHVEIHEYAVIGGVVPIHQFVKIGCHAMIGGGYRVNKDVCPYVMVGGYPLRPAGLNIIGMRRRGFSRETIATLKKAYSLLFNSNLNISQALKRISDELPQTPEIEKILSFVANSQRGIVC
jgi:UDP-N-acetylglucosamine acyltransferase